MLSKIGTGELLVILLVALFVVGPERLPKLARSLGKAVAGFKRYLNDMTDDLKESSGDLKDIASEMGKMRKDLSDAVESPLKTVTDPAKEILHEEKATEEEKIHA